MPFTRTYQEILEMISKGLLDTQMCRDIVRRAGLRPSGSGSSVGGIELWSGVNYGAPDAQGSFYTGQNLNPGAYIYPPFDNSGMGLQFALTDLANVAYVRGYALYPHGLNTNSSVAFMPIYTNVISPTVLSDWIAADGRTLDVWDAELAADTAPWNPPGAVPDPAGAEFVLAAGGAAVTGPWYAPPTEALEDLTHVLFGVAALIREFVTVDIYRVGFQAALVPVSDAFNAYFFD